MEPFIGMITMFGGNFAPRGWAFCDGQLLPIAQNTALFSLLGTTYGGDGRTTFGLPDLRGRLAMHPGSGPGLPTFRLGQKGGNKDAQLPQHTHNIDVLNGPGNQPNPGGNRIAGSIPAGRGTVDAPYTNGAGGTSLAGVQTAGVSPTDGNYPPFTCVNYIIALVGTFPSRS
jgi:microcystin-dependent protein